MGERKDLTGRRFGKLVVLSQTEKRMDGGSIVWRCRCDCGQFAEVSARRLIRGKVRSCGCLSAALYKDYVGKRFGRLTVTAPAGKIRKNGSTVTWWKCRCDCGRETVVTQSALQSGDTQSCGCLQKERTRECLGLAGGTSAAILERNKQVRKNNTSGYTGVVRTADGKWAAYINFKKKRYWLGRYADLEEAVKARQRGEEMHEEFLEWYYKTRGKDRVR